MPTLYKHINPDTETQAKTRNKTILRLKPLTSLTKLVKYYLLYLLPTIPVKY